MSVSNVGLSHTAQFEQLRAMNPHTPGETKYQEVICRLTEKEKTRLDFLLSTLDKTDENINELMQAIKENPTYKEDFFRSSDWPLYSLIALKRGLIDEYQFGTLQLYWSIGQYHGNYCDVQIIPLFTPDGENNPEAVEQIKTTFSGGDAPSFHRIPVKKDAQFLTDEQFKKFLDEMKAMPSSEKQFFLVPDMQQTGNTTNTVSQRIHDVGINVFSRILEVHRRIIPSLAMMQTILKVKFGDQAVKINPVLGLSSVEQLKNSRQRDMALHFPGVKLPEDADYFPAPWYDFTYHDFYHAILVSGVPAHFRSKLLAIADAAYNEASAFSPDSSEHQTLASIAETLIDMEISEFRSDFAGTEFQTDESKFWMQFKTIFHKSCMNSPYAKYDLHTAIVFFQKVAQRLILDKEGEECGLTLASLEKANKEQMQFLASFLVIDSIQILQYMVEAVKNGFCKRAINPCLQVEMESEKYVAGVERKRLQEKCRSPQSKTAQQVLSQQLMITAADWQKLETKGRLHVVPLLLAKISVNHILALDTETRAKILQNSVLIAVLIQRGVSWEKVSQPETVANIEKHAEIISLLLQMGATPEEIARLPEDLLERLKKKRCFLEKAAEKGHSFECIAALDAKRLELLIMNNFQLLDLLSLEAIQKMTLERLQIVAKGAFYIIPFIINNETYS